MGEYLSSPQRLVSVSQPAENRYEIHRLRLGSPFKQNKSLNWVSQADVYWPDTRAGISRALKVRLMYHSQLQ